MQSQFKINGTPTSIAPITIRWIPQQLGIDHNGQPVYSSNYQIDMRFDAGSVVWAREWIEGTSSGSVNLTVLNRLSLGYTDLSGVYVSIEEEPEINSILAGQFRLLVRNVTI